MQQQQQQHRQHDHRRQQQHRQQQQHGHVSRHSLGLLPSAIASVPFPGAGPEDAEGRTVHHNILCVAGWNDDVREHQLNLMNLNVQKLFGEIDDVPEVSLLSSFTVPRAVVSLDVSQETRGSTMAVAGGDDGALYRLKLSLPTAPGSSPSAIRLDTADIGETDLLEFCRPHRHHVSDVRVHASGEVAVSVSLEGSMCMTDLTSRSSQTVVQCAATSFTQCAFTRSSSSSIVTGSHQGCCVVWDARTPAGRSSASSVPGSSTGTLRMGNGANHVEPVTALATHPSKPHVFVCGGAAGLFKEYDFRYPEGPTFSERVGRDAITSICYENQGSSVERLRFCTEAGSLYKVIQGEGAALVYEEAHTPFTGLAVSPGVGDSQVFCATGAEAMVFLTTQSKYY
jgi:WD40 repeat protein